jgi:magnesium transporter
LAHISPNELNAVNELLKYPPHSTGRYMTPRFVTIRMDMTAREGLAHVRDKGRGMETIDVLYVLDDDGKLIKDMNLGALVLADPTATVRHIPGSDVALKAMTDREETLRAFEKYDRFVLPVTDDDGHMLGIITIDDILDVAAKETTEDLQKLSGLGALDEPYLEVGYLSAMRQRGGWLSILFFGEMLTATAMGYYEKEIAAAVVLALFVPLIISSGGNSGSQAATLVVRSLALGDLKLRDWYRVLGRELRSSMTLGAWLGMLGFVRIVLWQHLGWATYGQHYVLVGTTVWLALIGVVCFGSVVGSMLPFLLKRLGFDPATSSAPFVATLVDVTGLIIYFTCAILILRGTLL